jgi:hypothetical protein
MVSLNETNKIKKMLSMNAHTEHYKLLKMTLSEPGLQVLTRMKTHKHYLRRKAKNDAQNVSYLIEEDTGSNEDLNTINDDNRNVDLDDTNTSQAEMIEQLLNMNNKQSSDYRKLHKTLTTESKLELRRLNINKLFQSLRCESKQKYAEVKDKMEQSNDLDEELWIIITDYNNYSISNHGRVKNSKTNKILKPVFCANGRLFVNLCNCNGHKTVLIHELVADAFLEKVERKPYIDHIDCDHLNNHIDNLRFVNNKENSQNRGSDKNSTSKYKGVYFYIAKKWKAQITLDGNPIHLGYFSNEKDAARAYYAKATELSEYFRLNDISDDE